MSDTPHPKPQAAPEAATAPRTADAASQGGPSWVLPPGELPAGVQLALTAVVEATELRPEVMQALAHVAQEIHRSAATATPQVRCGQLTSCDNMTGDCSRLKHCGTYRSGPSPI